MDADLILVLEDGIISERGSHEELLRREGLYADLYRKQLLEQEIAELGWGVVMLRTERPNVRNKNLNIVPGKRMQPVMYHRWLATKTGIPFFALLSVLSDIDLLMCSTVPLTRRKQCANALLSGLHPFLSLSSSTVFHRRISSMYEGYDTAQICMNGHVVTKSAATSPEFRKKFCDTCGEATTMECLECNAPIQGKYHMPDIVFIGFGDYDPPYYCHNCGKPFPWTTRTLEAAAQLASEDGSLTDDEAAQFEDDLKQIIRESPRAKASANRIQRLLQKMTTVTASAIRDIIVDIASESVKKMILP